MQPPGICEDVRRRAYDIWEREGRPEGRELDHWLRAQAELASDEAITSLIDEENSIVLNKLEIKHKELIIKDLERQVRRGKINWTIVGPVSVAVVTGLIGLLSAAIISVINTNEQTAIAKLTLKTNSIIESVKTGIQNPDLAKNNILFFLDAGLVEDPGGKIRKLVQADRVPVLGASDLPTACPFDATKLSTKEILEKFEGGPVADETILKVTSQIKNKINNNISEKQMSALVSFVYNVGIGQLSGSSIIRLINSGQYFEAANAFLMWDRPEGRPFSGLRMRRLCERDLFLSGSR